MSELLHADVEHEEAPREGEAPRFLLVWVALAVLTMATFLIRRMPLGSTAHVVIALAIATTKSSLVVLFFMELRYHRGASRLVLVIAALFVLTLALLAIADVRTRFPLARPNAEILPAVTQPPAERPSDLRRERQRLAPPKPAPPRPRP